MIATQKNQMNVQFLSKRDLTKAFILLAVVSLVFMGTVYAGTDNGAFDEVWITLKDWTQGTLGRIISGAMILVGIVGGIARQSIMAFAVGIGSGLGLYNAPEIIETIMTATLDNAHNINTTVLNISNGLGF